MTKKTYTYNDKTYSSEYQVRQAIWEKDRIAFGKPDSAEKWAKLGVTYTEEEVVTPEPSLDVIKSRKLESLKAERDRLEVEPVVTDKGSFDFDESARDRLTIAQKALNTAGADATIAWTLSDDTSVDVSYADIEAVFVAAATRSNTLHVAYRVAKAAIEAASTKEEVEKIKLLED